MNEEWRGLCCLVDMRYSCLDEIRHDTDPKSRKTRFCSVKERKFSFKHSKANSFYSL